MAEPAPLDQRLRATLLNLLGNRAGKFNLKTHRVDYNCTSLTSAIPEDFQMAKGPRLRSFSIYLLKPNVNNPTDALLNPSLPHQPVVEGGATLGQLYVKPSMLHTPSWVAFFGGAISTSALKLENATTSAVFFLRVQNQWCAVGFGYPPA